MNAPRRRLRRAVWSAAAAALIVAIGAADRAGWFGRGGGGDDFAAYHDKEFLVVRIIDGDTFDIDCPDRRMRKRTTRIRLWGVDTPETNKPDTPVQHYGPEATAFTKSMVEGKRVRIRLATGLRTRGTYKRLLAYVELPDGRQLNRELVLGGYAYADTRFDHPAKRDYLAAMAEARRAGRGLWAEATPADLPAYLNGKFR